MFYKITIEEDNCIGVHAYFEKSDFEDLDKKIIHLSYTPKFIGSFLYKIVEEVSKEHAPENFEYHYAQLRFTYPIFHRRVETITEREFEKTKMSRAGIKAVNSFVEKIYDDFTSELKEMSAMEYQSYLNYDHRTMWERALCEGEIHILFKSSNYFSSKSILESEFPSKFLCVQWNNMKIKSGMTFVHEEDEKRYNERMTRIYQARDLHRREPSNFKLIHVSKVIAPEPKLEEFDA